MFEKYVKRNKDKINKLFENGIMIESVTNNQIILTNGFIIESDDNYIYYHDKNEYRNHGFTFFDNLNFKTIKLFIDNMMYDLFMGG